MQVGANVYGDGMDGVGWGVVGCGGVRAGLCVNW